MRNPSVYELVEWDTGRVLIHGTKSYIADQLGLSLYSVDTIISHARKGIGATRVAFFDPAIHYRASNGDQVIEGTCDEISKAIDRTRFSVMTAAQKGYVTTNGWRIEEVEPECWCAFGVRKRYNDAVSRLKSATRRGKVKRSKESR
jgi:hypothetical protein|nr:MAG TPA: hypothetical protein [Caudoviricetes sp.]